MAVLLTPIKVAVKVTADFVLTEDVLTTNTAVLEPAATRTWLGGVTDFEFVES